MSRWLYASPYVLAGLLMGFAGCSEDDDNGGRITINGNGGDGNGADTGAITLTVDFDGTVAQDRPVVVEVKEGQAAGPTKSATLPVADTTITIGGLSTDTSWVVALFLDEDNDGIWDDPDEPLVLYNQSATDQAVGPTGEPTRITLTPGQTVDIGTIAFTDTTALPGTDGDTGAITVTIDFADMVTDSTPLIVELKDDKPAAATKRAVLTTADTTITFTGVSTATTWVLAIFQDENDNGAWDDPAEPLVYFNEDAPGQAAGPADPATEISVTPGAVVEIGTISFGAGTES